MTDKKIAVITGSTGGIGSAIASQLASEGWALVLVNRNKAKAETQKDALGGTSVTLIEADLMDIAQIKRAGAEILELHPRIDALYNNSGVLTSQRVMSKEGHESNYAVNVLAPYMMVQALRPGLSRPEGPGCSMVVNTTSSVQSSVKKVDVEALSEPVEIGGLTGAYATSKLALTTAGSAMASALKGDGILLRSVDPGPVRTPMTRNNDAMPGFLRLIAMLIFKAPEKQARKMIDAANPESYGGRTGIYISDGKEKPLPKLANDPALQAALMKKLSEDAKGAE
jgi:NAD(P)-dependent dehydrogenase (short-subunit alcohol dehydrogenase family)